MGFLIFGLFVLMLLVIGGLVAVVWTGYAASRENYLKARRWKRNELRPRKYATGLSRKPPRPGRRLKARTGSR
jgi:hypothetical protein